MKNPSKSTFNKHVMKCLNYDFKDEADENKWTKAMIKKYGRSHINKVENKMNEIELNSFSGG